MCGRYVQGIDIVPTTTEHSRHPREHAEGVFNQN